jgi:hypothetical protein
VNQCKVCDLWVTKVHGVKHTPFHPLGTLVGLRDNSIIEMLCEVCVGWLNYLSGGRERWSR